MCLTRMEELESCLSGLLSTLKKNREHVPLEVLKTQYKQPYEELVRNINLTASAYAKSVLLHRLVLNPDADVEEQWNHNKYYHPLPADRYSCHS